MQGVPVSIQPVEHGLAFIGLLDTLEVSSAFWHIWESVFVSSLVAEAADAADKQARHNGSAEFICGFFVNFVFNDQQTARALVLQVCNLFPHEVMSVGHHGPVDLERFLPVHQHHLVVVFEAGCHMPSFSKRATVR